MREVGGKLYLEFGGKLFCDFHAARVLPGFDPNVKMRLLHKLRDKAEMVLCIWAGDIERRKMRADFGITYDVDAMKLIDDLKGWDLSIRAVVITRFDDQPAVRLFKNKLERRKIRVYTHRATKGYPTDIDTVVSAVKGADAIVHLGAIVGDSACSIHPDLTIEINLQATRTIAEVGKGFGIQRFVFASTCSVYGASDEILDERSVLRPISLYARTKMESEKMLLSLTDATFAPIV